MEQLSQIDARAVQSRLSSPVAFELSFDLTLHNLSFDLTLQILVILNLLRINNRLFADILDVGFADYSSTRSCSR